MESTHFAIELRGETFELRPLPMKVLDELGERFRRKRNPRAPHGAELQLAIDIAYRSLRQVHPRIERSYVADALDLKGLAVISQAMAHWKDESQQARHARRR